MGQISMWTHSQSDCGTRQNVNGEQLLASLVSPSHNAKPCKLWALFKEQFKQSLFTPEFFHLTPVMANAVASFLMHVQKNKKCLRILLDKKLFRCDISQQLLKSNYTSYSHEAFITLRRDLDI